MRELHALLRACKDTPEEDAPRLVLADWLEENGDEADRDRAEFVRLDCRRARLGWHDPDEAGVLARLYRLGMRHERRWLGPILESVSPRSLSFRRGLVEIEAEPGPLLERLPQDPETDPAWAWVGRLQLREGGLPRKPERLLVVLQDPRIGSFSFLHLDLNSGAEPWEALAATARGRLREARLVGRPGRTYGRALARCPLLEGLRVLNLLGARENLDDEALKELAQAPWLAGVRRLSLHGNQIGPAGLLALADSPYLKNLEGLNLAGNPIGDEGAGILAGHAAFASLTSLNLCRTGLTPAGGRALASSTTLHRLEILRLSENQLGDEGIVALADSPILTGVRDLALEFRDRYGKAAILALARSRLTRALTSLYLGNCNLDEEAGAALAGSASLAGLRRLEIGISAAALAAMTAGPGLDRLEILALRMVSDEDLGILTRCQGLPALVSLRLYPAQSSGALAQMLRESRLLRQLRRLHLVAHNWDPEGVEALCRLLDEGNLVDLLVPWCPLPEESLKRLARCSGLGRLVRFVAAEAKGITEPGLRSLATSPHGNRLALLDLSKCELGSSVAALQGGGLAGLAWISLSENRFGEAEAVVLRGLAEERPDLYLDVWGNSFRGAFGLERRWRLAHPFADE